MRPNKKAKWHEEKVMRMNAKLERRGEKLQVTDSESVPQEVRVAVTASIRNNLATRSVPRDIVHLTPVKKV